ncbi:Uncharacterised protein [Mycobacteroides abscessus subsp. abscessus]|nr:Uncharacterised protein [Mycobacteroides abscessus subsp. abscessus]
MREWGTDRHELGQRAVDRGRSVEAHGRAQVVVTTHRLRARRVGSLRLYRHALADA